MEEGFCAERMREILNIGNSFSAPHSASKLEFAALAVRPNIGRSWSKCRKTLRRRSFVAHARRRRLAPANR